MQLNFGSPVWVNAEILQLKESRGHYFLELVEKEENTDQIIAQASAIIWNKSFKNIIKKRGKAALEILKEGRRVRMLVKVEFNERYGFRLMPEDLDLNFTLGQLELQRQEVWKKLVAEELTDKNKAWPLPIVLQNVAVISSATAAGWSDFQAQVKNNIHQYSFNIDFYPAHVQGKQAERDIPLQLQEIEKLATKYDAVIITRGGGSKLDLSAFDSYEICKYIGLSSLPVLIGVGHEIDQSLADLVAHTSLKTPTAVAEFLIQRNQAYEEYLFYLWDKILNINRSSIHENKQLLQIVKDKISHTIQNDLNRKELMLKYMKSEIGNLGRHQLEREENNILHIQNIIENMRPENILKRGYSLTYHKGKVLSKNSDIKEGDVLKTLYDGGETQSKIIKNG